MCDHGARGLQRKWVRPTCLHAGSFAAAVLALSVVLSGCPAPREEGGEPVAADSSRTGNAQLNTSNARRLEITYPLDQTVFPPDIAAPTFRWEDGGSGAESWLVAFRFSDGGDELHFRSPAPEWTVPDDAWEAIKRRSREQAAQVAISGVRRTGAETVLSQAAVRISTSADEVGAPLFFREVNLPFISAVKNPAAHIRWRFGPISSPEPPPVVLDKLPVCGNCHSFSADGTILGMDIDYANDKGSYAVATVGARMTLDKDAMITWSDYRREDGDPTFGLLSQVSPDGRYVVSTVKDRSVFVATDDLAFSQLFFPFKGILAVYDRRTGQFQALPGADDERFVQSNPAWSPDGQTIVFARSPAYELKKLLGKNKVLLSADECDVFLKKGEKFRFDLYRIPFNAGRGGTPELVAGGSNNGVSNYFPRFSPDGRWIVFCRADSFMLLQPDSQLYIIPAAGGEARRLSCNTRRMNSWHSWSPNGKWLVFSSKAYSIYTQLMLTHIDQQGRSTPPVVLSRFTAPERAANIPEFVNAKPDAIRSITAAFLDDNNYYRAGEEFVRQDDPLGAVPLFEKAVELNPKHVLARLRLATISMDLGKIDEAKSHLDAVIACEPDSAGAHHLLGVIASRQGNRTQAVEHLRRALRVEPDFFAAHLSLGLVLVETGNLAEAERHFVKAVWLQPDDPFANYYYGYVLHRQGKLEEAAGRYSRALDKDPESVPALLALAVMRMKPELPLWHDPQQAVSLAETACKLTGRRSPDPLKILAAAYAAGGRNRDALDTANEALRLARTAGDLELAGRIELDRETYERAVAQGKAARP